MEVSLIEKPLLFPLCCMYKDVVASLSAGGSDFEMLLICNVDIWVNVTMLNCSEK